MIHAGDVGRFAPGGAFFHNQTGVVAEHAALVGVAEDVLVVAPVDAGPPAAADAAAGARRVGAHGGVGQLVQVADAFVDAERVGQCAATFDILFLGRGLGQLGTVWMACGLCRLGRRWLTAIL